MSPPPPRAFCTGYFAIAQYAGVATLLTPPERGQYATLSRYFAPLRGLNTRFLHRLFRRWLNTPVWLRL